jgi:hypothetical protein
MEGEDAERSPRAAAAVPSPPPPPPAPAGFSSCSPAREKKGWDFWGGRTKRRARGGLIGLGMALPPLRRELSPR